MKGIKDIIVKGSILAVLSVVFCMVSSFMSIKTVRAENCAEVVGGGSYSDVQTALYHAGNGDTVKLLRDVKTDSELTVSNNLILDLNGHTIDRQQGNSSVIKIKANKNLTLSDSSDTNAGLITGGS